MHTELLVRTSHVLIAIERSLHETTSRSNEAVVFGSFVTQVAA